MPHIDSLFHVRAKNLSGYLPEQAVIKFLGRKFQHSAIQPMAVTSGDQDLFSKTRSLMHSTKISACVMRWVDGRSWSETGIIDSSLAYIQKSGKPLDGCHTREDLVQRYGRLDQIFDEISKSGTIYSQPYDDAIIHINSDGSLLFGGGAHHRTAMAWILDILLPVRPMLVHEASKASLGKLLGG